MSGLDKFFKTPDKPQKKITPKTPKTPIKSAEPKPPPKRGGKRESQKADEKIPQLDESENGNTFQDLPPDASIEGEEMRINLEVVPSSRKFTKFQLRCIDKKCNYQRILMKPTLSASDMTCPKCGSEMRQKTVED